MCAANAFAVLMSCVAAYLYCRTRLKVTPEWSFIGSVLLFVLSRFLGLVAADGIALLPMTLIVLAIFEKRFLVFVAMVLLGVLVNEKTAIVATLFVAGRLIFSEGNRSFYLGSLLVALATVAGVFAVASVLQFPGAEYQRDPSTYLSSALNMLKDLFTPKGVYRNLLLPASLIGLWLIALCAPHRRQSRTTCRPGSDPGHGSNLLRRGCQIQYRPHLRVCRSDVRDRRSPSVVMDAVRASSCPRDPAAKPLGPVSYPRQARAYFVN